MIFLFERIASTALKHRRNSHQPEPSAETMSSHPLPLPAAGRGGMDSHCATPLHSSFQEVNEGHASDSTLMKVFTAAAPPYKSAPSCPSVQRHFLINALLVASCCSTLGQRGLAEFLWLFTR